MGVRPPPLKHKKNQLGPDFHNFNVTFEKIFASLRSIFSLHLEFLAPPQFNITAPGILYVLMYLASNILKNNNLKYVLRRHIFKEYIKNNNISWF